MEFRRAKPEEVEQIIDLANYVFRTSSNLEPSMGRQFPLFLSPENASDLHVAVDDGKIVSHIGIRKSTAMINGHKLSMAGMGSVCTHPDYRGQGLATKLLYQVFDSLEEEGVAVLKISGNRGLYKNNGCLEIDGIVSYTFDKGSCDKYSWPQTLESGIRYAYIDKPEDASVLADIYQKEPVRYQRAKWEFPVLFKAMPTVHPPAGRIYTAVVAQRTQSDGAGFAYTIGYEVKPGIYEIIEYAGERWVIPSMVRYLLEEKNMEKVQIHFHSCDGVLAEIFDSYCPGEKSISLSPITAKIINRDALWSGVYPIIAEKWPDRNPPQSVEELENIAHQQNRDILRFLFESYRRPADDKPWDAILPIPLPWFSGLNYV